MIFKISFQNGINFYSIKLLIAYKKNLFREQLPLICFNIHLYLSTNKMNKKIKKYFNISMTTSKYFKKYKNKIKVKYFNIFM